ncbi:MAG: universal stress protein [Alphaproteobacteria bacterium]|nr:universal stress protein [Alphaproteobacteria bacterium]
MPMKRILLPINGRDAIDPVVQLAFSLARKIVAEVEVAHPHTPYYEVITTVGEGGSPMQVAQDIESARVRFETENVEARKRYDAMVENNPGVKTTYFDEEGNASDIVMRRAFSSDLIVLGNAAAFDTPFWRDVYDGALIHSTRPVLIAPTKPQDTNTEKLFASELLIAWSGTAESARALTAAVPFFATAKQVRIMTISDDPRQIDTSNQMKQYAQLHGANASVVVVDPGGKGIAQTLLDEASERPGTMLVMGAYSHARWRERLFGGVTEYVLHHADVPILMAH